MKNILKFQGKYRFLSNFYPAKVVFEGMEFPTSEHAYQAAKTLNMEVRQEFNSSLTPGQAKRKAKLIKLREDWELIKISIMYDIVKSKFNLNENLANKLLETSDSVLVEGNTWGDTFWGMDMRVNPPVGENYLGKILMMIRSEIIQ